MSADETRAQAAWRNEIEERKAVALRRLASVEAMRVGELRELRESIDRLTAALSPAASLDSQESPK